MDERPDLSELPIRAPAKEPPRPFLAVINASDQRTPCGSQRVVVTPDSGQYRGLPLQLYCQVLVNPETAMPRCVEQGACTGPRFVPTLDQYTVADPNSPLRRRRKPAPKEIIAAIRFAARRAAKETGRRDTRSDREIAAHVAETWVKAKRAFQGEGEWTR